jgi:exopolysaccharide biosynthesis polyprenyl glycosylphosphotransferase
MVYYRAHGLGILHHWAQFAGTVALLWVWRFSMDYFYQPSYLQYSKLVVYTLAIGLVFGIQSVHPERRFRYLLHASNQELGWWSLRQTLIIFSAITLFVSAIKDTAISRAYLFSSFPILFTFLYSSAKWLPDTLSAFLFPGRLQQPTVVIGPPERVHQFAPWLKRKKAYGMSVVGYLHSAPASNADLQYLGTLCDLELVIKSNHIAQLIMLEMPAKDDVLFLVDLCDRLGVRLLMVNDLPYKLHKPLTFIEEDGVQLIAFRQEPLECPVNRIMKRILDISLSLPVVIFILPITNLAVYLLQRREAPGPLFFLQRRTGFQNEEFFIYKYRTMRLENPNEAAQATADDARVYTGGRWLRKHSLDELPQFINVLKGEMSIVGPRPHLPEHTHWFNNAAHGFTIRSFIKPGITGLAQVEGFRGEVKELKNLTDRIRSDLFYLENWSLTLEWKIILKTALQIIRPPKSAY